MRRYESDRADALNAALATREAELSVARRHIDLMRTRAADSDDTASKVTKPGLEMALAETQAKVAEVALLPISQKKHDKKKRFV